MESLIHNLSSDDWLKSANQIEKELKPLIQGPKGVIKIIKQEIFNQSKNEKLRDIRENFDSKKSTNNLDDRINEYSNKIYLVNTEINDRLSFDYIGLFSKHINWDSTNKALEIVVNAIKNNKINNTYVLNRLHGILSKLVIGSISQSNKILAGIAGEELGRAILVSAGLIENKTFRAQYISEYGSKTDFITPAIEDNNDHNVQCFIAVQYSSNDRARMVDSELNVNGNKFFITFNGCQDSTKKLKDIGKPILASQQLKRFQLVCLKHHLEDEKERLNDIITSNTKDNKNNKRVLEFLKSNSLGFEEFAINLQKRYV